MATIFTRIIDGEIPARSSGVTTGAWRSCRSTRWRSGTRWSCRSRRSTTGSTPTRAGGAPVRVTHRIGDAQKAAFCSARVGRDHRRLRGAARAHPRDPHRPHVASCPSPTPPTSVDPTTSSRPRRRSAPRSRPTPAVVADRSRGSRAASCPGASCGSISSAPLLRTLLTSVEPGASSAGRRVPARAASRACRCSGWSGRATLPHRLGQDHRHPVVDRRHRAVGAAW